MRGERGTKRELGKGEQKERGDRGKFDAQPCIVSSRVTKIEKIEITSSKI